jgi:hypothetical protein
MVYKEKVPDEAKPFVTNFFTNREKISALPTNEEEECSELQEFLQDPHMPYPTEAELEVLIAVKMRDRKLTKWFYKSLVEDLRNRGLVKMKNICNEELMSRAARR